MLTLVTGAAGHVGLTLTQKLVASGRTVRVLDMKNNPTLEALPVEFIQADVRDRSSLEAAFEGVDVVYHMAAYISIYMDEWPILEAININGVRHIVELCKKHQVRRLVHFSSIEALSVDPAERPIDETNALVTPDFPIPYPRSKAAGQRIVLQAIQDGLDAVIVQPTGIIGPNDYSLRAANRILLQIANGEIPALPRMGYDWVDVRDVVEGAIAAEQKGSRGTAYILGNERFDLPELGKQISALVGRSAPLTLPMWTAKLGLPFIEFGAALAGRHTTINRASFYPLTYSHEISHARAARDLGYQPRPIEETLADMVSWFKQIGKITRQS